MGRADRKRITIIGSGAIGASLGLALRASPNAARFEVVGHDREPLTARRAMKAGAFDRVALTLGGALERTVMVILAVPLAALRPLLADVGEILADVDGVLITDTAPLKAPVLRWAEEHLPAGLHFVGGDPFLAPQEGRWHLARGLEAARADLFHGARYAIVPPARGHEGAVRTMADLAALVGAEPLLMEPLEHDMARLLAEMLPAFAAAALVQSTARRPGWREARRAAGYGYATATAAVELEDPESLRMMAMLRREALLPRLDAFIEAAQALRRRLAEGDADSLEAAFAAAQQARAAWASAAHAHRWEFEPTMPPLLDLFRRTAQAVVGRWGAADEEPSGER